MTNGSVEPDVAVATGPSGLSQVVAPYMVVFFVAFFAAIVITPFMRLLATRYGIVDWPDLRRKSHIQPVAYLGGVAIFAGWLAGVTLCFILPLETGALSSADLRALMSIVVGAGAITLTGLFDDVYHMSPRVKVGGQLFAAAALASQDVGIRLVENSLFLAGVQGAPELVVYVLGTIVIAVFVIGGCNSMNLLDGLDGLAAGIGAIACTGFLIIAALVALRASGQEAETAEATAYLLSHPVRLVMCLAIVGTLLGFLPYNFNPATIFMGDAGSLLLGYLCATTILLFSNVAKTGLPLVTACLIVFALPITDTALAIFRRKVAGRSITAPDDRHIHHMLRRVGLSMKQSVVVLYGAAIVFAAVGCSMVWLELRWRYMLAVFVVLYGFIMVTAYKVGLRKMWLEKWKAGGNATPETAEAEGDSFLAGPPTDLPSSRREAGLPAAGQESGATANSDQ